MDNKTQGKNSTNKNEKLGTDGLTKKERRALKVQGKQPVQPESVAAIKPPSDCKPKPSVNTGCKPKPTENNVKISQPPESASKNDEKEQRRKEWARKLAEQNQTEKNQANDEGLSKAQLRAKRREQQEAQRQAKTAPTTANITLAKSPPKPEQKKPVVEPKKAGTRKIDTVSKVPLVHHLYSEEPTKIDYDNLIINIKGVHPAFIRLGVQYSNKTILGSNARCLALLAALKSLVEDLLTPPKQEFCRYLEATLQKCVDFLQLNRPIRLFAVSMTNALRHFKLHVTQIDKNDSDDKKKEELLRFIDTYVSDEIAKAGEAISLKVKGKITNGDVILTYGCSSLIRRILLDAHKEGKCFEVVVVDGRPLLEGREMLRRLSEAGIRCSYVLINAVSYMMNSVTKILMGAHALLANGYVMSRTGTAQVALVACAYNKPVLVCCETYKFSERVLTDSFVYNEIGDPDELVTVDTQAGVSPLKDWQSEKYLTPLNLLYDVTPPDLVTAVVTELGFLPCTSVPVVLRIKPVDLI